MAAQRAFSLEEQSVRLLGETAQKRWRERRKLVEAEVKRIAGLGQS